MMLLHPVICSDLINTTYRYLFYATESRQSEDDYDDGGDSTSDYEPELERESVLMAINPAEAEDGFNTVIPPENPTDEPAESESDPESVSEADQDDRDEDEEEPLRNLISSTIANSTKVALPG
jgi:hypothetical protein